MEPDYPGAGEAGYLNEIELLEDDSIELTPFFYDNLPKQKDCPVGASFIGKIVHVVSPDEFYILPENAWECCAGCGDNSQKEAYKRKDLCKEFDHGSKQPNDSNENEKFEKQEEELESSGLSLFMDMMDELQKEMTQPKEIKIYVKSQIVACYVQHEVGIFEWCRAAVTSSTGLIELAEDGQFYVVQSTHQIDPPPNV